MELQRAVLRWNEQTCLPGQQTNCSSRAVAFSLQVRAAGPELVLLLCRCHNVVPESFLCALVF
jgi:hypothetical protein